MIARHNYSLFLTENILKQPFGYLSGNIQIIYETPNYEVTKLEFHNPFFFIVSGLRECSTGRQVTIFLIFLKGIMDT